MAVSTIQSKADYIVEKGTSGIWTYRKWNSGTAECWGVYNGASEPLTVGNPLTPEGKYWLKAITYPFDFAEYPIVSASGVIGTGYSILARSYEFRDKAQVLVYTSVAEARASVRMGFYVIGRWK